MMKVLKRLPYFLGCTIIALLSQFGTAIAQSGDQILDGIGETGMIARYLFRGDLKDWSRNNLHAKYLGENTPTFKDDKPGKVLALNGSQKNYLQLPNEALNDLESLSISSWIFLSKDAKNSYLFDFSFDKEHEVGGQIKQEANQHIYEFAFRNQKTKHTVSLTSLPADQWAHIVSVIDIPSKSISIYLNGKKMAEKSNVSIDFSGLSQSNNASKRQLTVGQNNINQGNTLQALLHDFRIYRVALTGNQVQTIYENAKNGGQSSGNRVNQRPHDGEEMPSFPMTQAQLYNAYLQTVEDIEVETLVGESPRLPTHVQGSYAEGLEGPKVRVIWPAPTDNTAVQAIGKYTVIGRIPGTNLQPKAHVTIKEKKGSKAPKKVLEAFPLDHVALNNNASNEKNPFISNRDKFIQGLANTNPDDFLYMFRNAFGVKQPDGAKPLGVWDSQDTKLRGHATGHYLTAIAQAYAGTGYDPKLQENFKQKISYMIETLYELSNMSGKANKDGNSAVADAKLVPPGSGKEGFDSDLSVEGIRTDYWNWGEGYISAYPPDQFIMLEQGAKYGGQKNQVWAPYYTLHKILAGLIDIYTQTGNKKALDVATGMADWVESRLSAVPADTLRAMWNTYIAGEFGGMNETLAHLYQITEEAKYWKAAQLFDNVDMFFGNAERTHGLAKNIDTFRGLHANQHIPQIVGSIEMYGVSDELDYFKIADNFWFKAVNDYMYSIGGVAGARNPVNAECFIAEPATIYQNGFSSGGQNETCATYNMLKLTSSLFMYEQRPELMDYYERGLYNHILASVAEDSPANTYHVPLRPASVKQFGNPHLNGFTCCNGTAIESSTKLQHAIYFKSIDNNDLYVNLFIPSTLNWNERNIRIEQETDFPKKDHTKLTVRGKGKFAIHLRVPSWATKGAQVKINGRTQNIKAEAGSYVKLSQNWKDGDVIEWQLPFQFRLEPVMDQQNIASLFYGPVLLAAQEPEARKDWRPITLHAKELGNTITGDPQALQFNIDGVEFKPFYESYGRHSVYLDVTLK
ncbi:beta-L-arabinofuranosidase domain-containing protein [Sphingobacterium corticis]|uniref:Beta-L-arabinofuranosidase domain-containing protein n=1 Tax=Sphingobacterium corticis TaxID=1812823 RepID=A0ABW5NJD8_9SPHI